MRWNVVQRDWLNIQIQTCTMLARSRDWSRGMSTYLHFGAGPGRDSIIIYLLAYRTARFTSFHFTLLYYHLSFQYTPFPFYFTFTSLFFR